MPASIRDRIFDPFFTTKPVGKGTGLGLSVVYGIMQAHKGAIRVYSEPGHGTVFKLYFPFSEDSLAQGLHTEPAPVAKGNGLVLIAEDDKPVQALARRVLERNGFEVLTADDGMQALAMIDEHHSRLKLVMLDVLMPKLYGVQVFEEMRAKYPGIPVLFCSGYSADMLPSAMAPDKGTALITKPYASRDLLEAIHKLVDRA